jgi:hypothetical protein
MPLPDLIFLVGGGRTFPIHIDESRTWTVAQLKEIIKVNVAPGLDTVAAPDLRLYHVSIDKSYDQMERINELKRLSENLKERPEVVDLVDIFETFRKRPFPGEIDVILVRTPEGESIYCGGLVIIPDVANTLNTQLRRPMIRLLPP